MCSVTQLCLTLCDPMDCSPPGSSVHGIFQARILEWGAISFSRNATIALIYYAMLEGHLTKFNAHDNLTVLLLLSLLNSKDVRAGH